ncbi:glycosyltransferase [Psychrobacter sp. 72-O-c]|uniref:glycosyltransferase n=1 Tax=Psychrobacter sp. 72-O-c TaxID=2774125 RepID=UPI001919DFA0|nr:glycosyltransferase [Psychrobacter sp. 72-O-c]
MKKILLMNVLYKPNIGGVENSLSEISKVLIGNGYKVDIFCSNKNNEDDTNLEFIYKEDRTEVYRYNYEYGKFSFFKNILNSRKVLKKLTNENKYSFIISRNYFLVIVAAMTGVKSIKYIPPEVSYYSKKGARSKSSLKELSRDSIKFLLQWFALILSKDVYVLSESMFNQVRQISLRLISPEIINPGINLNRFSIPDLEERNKLKKFYDVSENKKVLLALGRFSEVKQFDLVILAMTLLPDDYLLILVGSGPEREKYQNIINKNNLKDRVLLFNSTTSPEDFYKMADVFLMTSRYESFGQTILEACVSGLQIISFSRKSGVNTNIELMLSECEGIYLVEEQSTDALANTIIQSFENKKIAHSNFTKNQNILSKRYSWSNFVSSLNIPIDKF